MSEADTSKWSDENSKYSDRAIARILRFDKARMMGYEVGTDGVLGDIRYRAPEQLKGKLYSSKADVWAFGVILFCMLTGVHPYDYDDN